MKINCLIVSVLIMAGCSTTPPAIQEGPNAEVSYDGLHKIDNAVFAAAWADPDIDFSRYNKVMAGGAFFEFRAVKKTPTATFQRRNVNNENEFYIPDSARDKLVEEVSKIFAEEVAKSTRFEIAEQKGADVLILRGGLHDIVSLVPPELMGRGQIYLRSVGEATLILELADSMTDETIYRAVERRSMERPGGGGMLSTPVTTWAEVRRLARRWATTLREGLDSIPTQ